MDGEPSSKRIKPDDSLLHNERLNLNLHSLKDLREFTNDFSDENLLGQGGFGAVYKGLLPNGNIIAVKKLFTSTLPGLQEKQYKNEVRHLMRLIHPNIVKLVGYCSETEEDLVLHNGKYVYAEKSERLLCLEYMPKGSLCNHISDASSGLDWNTRYKIIVGICYGLHYLHEEWQPRTPIIHRDLKPANILLDNNMMPKIGDFGLSRLFGEEQTRTITKQFHGTLGYMAPEYLNRGIITKGLDIFSLGVIIIQVVSGQKHYPYKDDETSSQEFIELVLKEWRNRLEKVPGYTSKEFDCQQIRRCVEIGLLCLRFDHAERPTTRQIIEMLASKDAECSNERAGLGGARLLPAPPLLPSLPPGFPFHPTDEELVMHYLCRRCAGLPISVPIIAEIDNVYKYDPWQLPRMALYGTKEWYFFSPRDRKYPNGSRPIRAAGTGYWKPTGFDKPVGTPKPLAIKNALVFYVGKAPKGDKTNWIMHEYRLADVDRSARKKNHSLRLDDWVLCRIYNKKGAAAEKPSSGCSDGAPASSSHGAHQVPSSMAMGSPPEQKPSVLPPPAGYAPPPFSELAAYYEVRPSDSMPRAHGADSSCSGHALAATSSCGGGGGERPEVQSQPKIAEWERTFAGGAGPGVNPAGALLGGHQQLGPAAGGGGDDPLLQDILTYWGKPY